MLLYIDYNNKYCFIVPPKCGNTSIAHTLNINFSIQYTYEEVIRVLTSDEFKKIIVLRNIYDRFLSGFYEDLKNNSCYKNFQ